MSRRDFACGVIKKWCEGLGFVNIEVEPDGRLSLAFNDFLVTFAYSDQPLETIWVYLDLGELENNGPDDLASLFELNLQTWLVRTMTVGLDNKTGRVIAWNIIPVTHLNETALQELVQAMLTVATSLRIGLNRRAIAEPPAPSLVDPSPAPFDPNILRI